MAIFNFRAIGPVFIASVGNYSVNIYNDAYTPIDTADMNQINVLGLSRGIYYNLLECDDPTGFADFSEGFSGIHKEIVSGIKLKLGGADVGSSNPLPVTKISDATSTATTGNGTITTGGTSQVLLTAKTRKGYWVRNHSSASLYINRSGGAATTSHFEIKSGDYFETPLWENVNTKIEIFGATTGQAFCYGECV